jgi:hypothetical protein
MQTDMSFGPWQSLWRPGRLRSRVTGQKRKSPCCKHHRMTRCCSEDFFLSVSVISYAEILLESGRAVQRPAVPRADDGSQPRTSGTALHATLALYNNCGLPRATLASYSCGLPARTLRATIRVREKDVGGTPQKGRREVIRRDAPADVTERGVASVWDARETRATALRRCRPRRRAPCRRQRPCPRRASWPPRAPDHLAPRVAQL